MFQFSTIGDYHSALKDGILTCEAVVIQYIHRIHETRDLNAFVEVYEEEAIARARELDRQRAEGLPLGKLHGVVAGIKDVICYKGHKVSAASAILKDFTSLFSATAVERMLNEGAIIIGNLNCDEFAMGSSNENSVYGKVLNALDHSRVPGGSSGGSAVAVQSGCCMVSLGTDTGGSVRQPADFCGVVGLKPTYGRVSRHGLIAYASSFDQIGIFGLHPADVAVTLEVISGKDDYDSTVSAEPTPKTSFDQPCTVKRVAWLKPALDHPSLDPEIRGQILGTISKLKSEGYTVEPVDFEYLDYIVPAYYILTTAEASSNLSRYDGVRFGHRTNSSSDLLTFYKKTRSEGFGQEVKKRILLGTFVLSEGYYDAYFTKAQQVRKLITERTEEIFRNYEAIILPTVPRTAFKIGEIIADPIAMYLADIYTVYANLVGIPAVSIPLFRHSNGMPFGLQIMSNRFKEVSLLQLSHQMMLQHSDNIR